MLQANNETMIFEDCFNEFKLSLSFGYSIPSKIHLTLLVRSAVQKILFFKSLPIYISFAQRLYAQNFGVISNQNGKKIDP